MPNDSKEDLRTLAEFASSLKLADLPAEVAEKAVACLLYGLAIAIGGVAAQPPRRAARALDRLQVRGQATRLLDGRLVPPGAAALANAALFHTRVQDESHAVGHLGVVILPVALAVAEQNRASGAEALAGIVAGYEVALRIGRDHVAALSNQGFRSTPAYGVFGAAAAVSRIAKLSGEVTRNALSLSAGFACGLREFSNAGTSEYAFQVGISAQNGLIAACLAAEGVDAAPDILEGEAGFYRAFGGQHGEFARRLTTGLGKDYEMLAIGYRPYPVCQFHRSIIRCVLKLRESAAGAALRSIRIHMNPFEADFFGVRGSGPFETFTQAFMSAPFCAALAWTKGSVTLAGMHALADPEVLSAVPAMTVVSDATRERYKPALLLTLADGRSLSWEETEGSSTYLLTWQQAVGMAGVIGEEMRIGASLVRQLVESVDSLRDASSVLPVVEASRACIQAINIR